MTAELWVKIELTLILIFFLSVIAGMTVGTETPRLFKSMAVLLVSSLALVLGFAIVGIWTIK